MPKLELDENHLYQLDNRRIIGVTEALSILDDRWKVDPFYLERGRIIHLCTEMYDLDELDESSIDERIKPYFEAYVKFQKDTGFIPYMIEKPLYHPQYLYAGKIDRTGSFLNPENQDLLDLKSGAKSRIDELQIAAYWELCRINEIKIKKSFVLYLKDSGTYSLVEVEKPRLLMPIFLACLKITQWKEGL